MIEDFVVLLKMKAAGDFSEWKFVSSFLVAANNLFS